MCQVRDEPNAKRTEWDIRQAADLIGEVRVGIELAGSSLAGLSRLGPTAVVSGFGNNLGLLLGPVVEAWPERLDSLVFAMFINNQRVGIGDGARLSGGPLESVRFCLENCARRGRPLRAGQWISTGALTGVHPISEADRVAVMSGEDCLIDAIVVTSPAQV